MSAWLHLIINPIYLVVCLLLAFAGRKRRTGFFGWLIFSILLTPVVMLFVLVVGREKKKYRITDQDEDELGPVRKGRRAA